MASIPISLNQRVSGKVGLLSGVMLAFVFTIIVCSMIRVSSIRLEMLELVEIDIPFTEAISEVEILQLELHILMEKIHLAQYKDVVAVIVPTQSLLSRYKQVDLNLQHHINNATKILDDALKQDLIINDLAQYKKIQKDLHVLKKMQNTFSHSIVEMLTDIESNQLTNLQWSNLEKGFEHLDSTTIGLLKQIHLLLKDVAQKTAQHAEQFFWILTYLGLSAFIIGVFFTVHTVKFVQNRFSKIHTQLHQASCSIEEQGGPALLKPNSSQKDEFEHLSKHIQHVVDSYSDALSARYQAEKGLLKLAMTDKLTGAYNRHKWDDLIDLELSMISRGSQFSIIHIDLDHFKTINDQYGHNVGDIVLKKSVIIMRRAVRESDLIFRMGGEEFIVFLRNTSLEESTRLAEKIRLAFESFKQEGLPSFTSSFGVTESQNSDTESILLERVDRALYEAKHTGRNKVVSV